MKTTGILLLIFSALAATTATAYEPAGTPEDWPSPMGAPKPYWQVLGERVETGYDRDVDSYLWEVQGWYGTDHRRLWFKTEGEGEQGESPEQAELQLLYSRLFAPFWDWQIGIRQDFEPTPGRTHLVFGLQGVVPYEFEWDSAVFISEKGNVTARVEAEYDLNLTQRWVLQPRFELNAAFSDDSEIGLGEGLSNTELGVRVRYQFRREFAPYLGVAWEQLYGDSKKFARSEGEATSTTSLVLGIRFWF